MVYAYTCIKLVVFIRPKKSRNPRNWMTGSYRVNAIVKIPWANITINWWFFMPFLFTTNQIIWERRAIFRIEI